MKAFHGGASFGAIGEDFADLDRRNEVINADVLDAWYNPSPNVVKAIQPHLEWLIKTSPPTHGDGLREVIAEVRGLSPDHLVLGAGSSALMYLALPSLLAGKRRVLLLDPMYGEYSHIVRTVGGIEPILLELPEASDFAADRASLVSAMASAEAVILVNPNSPTGQVIPAEWILEGIQGMSDDAWVWVDETYVDFAGDGASLERYIADEPRLIVSKSMSKFYGLSGLRIGYLATSRPARSDWDRLTPPWSVGLIAQVAAVAALRDREYYAEMAQQTSLLRAEFECGLTKLELHVVPSTANYLMFRLPNQTASELCCKTAEQGVFLRNCDSLSARFQGRYVRSAVKSAIDNRKILEVLSSALLG